ncbi:MAG: hypothetical protein E7324_07020 [Clostridiales bacterium]|nr:hypothetical protein [Clostridiales bacterium]
MHIQRFICLAAALLLCLGAFPGFSEEADPLPKAEGRMRALLIGCDYFVTQDATWPAADNNLQLLSDTLFYDHRGYQLIRSLSGVVATVDEFETAVRQAFDGAQEGDTSLLYISTHGVFDEGATSAAASLLLSDGEREESLTAPQLQRIMDAVPGRKVLILDACNSGAFIGKGLSGGADRIFFTGPDYKVLCSAGGSEASWYWHGAEDAQSSGASYFATVLANALGKRGDHAADGNFDGRITLREAYAFLRDNYAASTPQVYPEHEDDFPLYVYDPGEIFQVEKAVTDITFEDTLLTAGESRVSFSFTVRRQVELYYQIVYHENGSWQFGIAEHFRDEEQEDGTTLPGRKMRTLNLNTKDGSAYGYAMIQLITLEEGQPRFQGARLLCVQPAQGEVQLSIATDGGFAPHIGQEMSIIVQHDVPCGLTVNILDEEENLVRRLAYTQPSRPQQLYPAGTTFYWDGRDQEGQMALPGLYTVQVRVRLGGKTYLTQSAPFSLLSRSERANENQPAQSSGLQPCPQPEYNNEPENQE